MENKEYAKQRRSAVKDAVKDYVDNTDNRLLSYIKQCHSESLTATQAGISLKFKLDEFKTFCEWIETMGNKDVKYLLTLSNGKLLLSEPIQDIE